MRLFTTILFFCALPGLAGCADSTEETPPPAVSQEFLSWYEHVQTPLSTPHNQTAMENIVPVLSALRDLDGEALSALVAEDFVQHNPMLEDGKKALLTLALEGARPRGGGDNLLLGTRRMLVDKGTVLLHRRGKLGPLESVGFDVLRFNETGQLSEHWAFLQPVEAGFVDNVLFSFVVPRPLDLIPTGERQEAELTRSVLSRSGEQIDLSQQDSNDNRAVVEAYLQVLYQPGTNLSRLAEYLDKGFVIHLAGVEAGREAWLGVLENAQQRPAPPKIEMVLAQNDLVWVLTRIPEVRAIDVPELASADLFRVRDRQILEQWKIVQPSPRFSKNSNSLF